MNGTTNIIEFPKLNIFGLELDRVALHDLFGTGLNIYWYAVIITAGMILALAFCMWRAKDFGLKSDNIIDVALWAVPFGLIGARAYYVLLRLDRFETFWDMINFRNGGLAIYGGIIAGFVTGFIFCKIKKIDILAMFDCCSFGFFIGQAIGRWGNFINTEAYGSLTDLPWGMTIQRYTETDGVVSLADNIIGPVHPTFLYESLWNVVGFIIALVLIKRIRKENGECFFFYMAWYGLGRAFIEGLRADSLKLFGVLRVSQLLGIIFCVLSVACLVLIRLGVWRKFLDKYTEKKREKSGYYAPVFEHGDEQVVEPDTSDADLFVASLEAHKNMNQSEIENSDNKE